MSQQSNIDLAIFNDVPGQDVLEILFNLNQENVPEVGSLPSLSNLKNLIQLSALNFALTIQAPGELGCKTRYVLYQKNDPAITGPY